MTSTLLDSIASFAPTLRAPGSPQAALYSNGSRDEVMSTGSDLGLEGEVVDLATEMEPSFFETGQLMWEMSARTERISDEEPSMQRPEIVLTDSSFLSVSVVQDDLVSQEDFERAQDSRNVAEDEQDNFDQQEKQVLSGQHCFELLTDEDGPMCENITDVDDDEFHKAEMDGIGAKPKLNEMTLAQLEASTSSSNDLSASSEPSDTLSCPVHSVIDDCDWMDRQYGNKSNQGRTANAQGMKAVKSYFMDSAPSLMIPSSKKTDSITLSDSASDLFATYDLDFRIGQFHSAPRRKRAYTMRPNQPHRPPLMPNASLPAGYFDIGRSVTSLNIRRPSRSEENSPRAHKPGCSLKDVFTLAMNRFNEVLYNCTHAKQRRQERKILKKLQARSNGNITPSSSATGAYRRRHTFICQKMEGMINNESKLKSTRRLARSRTASIATVRRTAGASHGI